MTWYYAINPGHLEYEGVTSLEQLAGALNKDDSRFGYNEWSVCQHVATLDKGLITEVTDGGYALMDEGAANWCGGRTIDKALECTKDGGQDRRHPIYVYVHIKTLYIKPERVVL